MNRKQYLLLVVLTIVAGLVGGAMSNRVFMARTVAAEEAKQDKKVITAEEFRLVDGNGETRAILGTILGGPLGGPYLWFYNDKGDPAIMLGAADNRPHLSLWCSKRKAGISLNAAEDEAELVLFSDRGIDSKAGITLSIAGDKTKLSLCGSKGKGCISFDAAEDEAKLSFSGGGGNAGLGVLDDNTWLSFLDDNGNLRVSLGMYDNMPSLNLYDENGTSRAALGSTTLETTRTGATTTRAISSLVLFDKDGKVMWKAPSY